MRADGNPLSRRPINMAPEYIGLTLETSERKTLLVLRGTLLGMNHAVSIRSGAIPPKEMIYITYPNMSVAVFVG